MKVNNFLYATMNKFTFLSIQIITKININGTRLISVAIRRDSTNPFIWFLLGRNNSNLEVSKRWKEGKQRLYDL